MDREKIALKLSLAVLDETDALESYEQSSIEELASKVGKLYKAILQEITPEDDGEEAAPEGDDAETSAAQDDGEEPAPKDAESPAPSSKES